MPLNVGSRLGHYDVTALIGEGGMGQVYQATDTKLNRQVALKILPECQGRSKIRPPWRRKTRPFGSWVEWRNAAVRRGRQDAGVAAGGRAFLLCSRR